MAIDAGKYKTKYAIFDEKEDSHYRTHSYPTKISEGNLLDDNIEDNTYVMEINGESYKVGSGATGHTKLEMSKLSPEHKISALTAIALEANDGDEFIVVVGCPLLEYQIVEKRGKYRTELLPKGEVTVTLKSKSREAFVKKSFMIKEIEVLPESYGVLLLNPTRFADGTVGVIDIGGGTAIGNISENFEIQQEFSMTTELGGNVLVARLVQELSSRFGKVNESLVSKILNRMPQDRYLSLKRGSEEDIARVKEESSKAIKQSIDAYIEEIKEAVRAKNWSLSFMDIVFIGGTSELLAEEIQQAFGNDVYIPINAELTNAVGFLKRIMSIYEPQKVVRTKEKFPDVKEAPPKFMDVEKNSA